MVSLQVICFKNYLGINLRPVFWTFLSEPSAAPLNVTGHNTSSTSILVVYGDVPAFDQNGIIKNYTITYRSLTEGHNGSAIAGPSDRQKELTNLREYVDYEITVLASTSKGDGPQSSPILVSTDEDSKYCYFPNLLSVINVLHPTSVCIFSILFPLHMQRCWQGGLVDQSTASLAGDRFLYCCDFIVWFRGEIVRKIGW